jgi:TolB-like protein
MLVAAASHMIVWRSGGIDSLAVLPLVNADGDPNTEYLSDGISESLITNLSRLPRLKVKSRDAVFAYKARVLDARTVGRELGVRAVLSGRVIERGNDLSIVVELVDARDDTLIWSDQYNRKVSDLLALEPGISQEISERLRLKLTGEERRQLAALPTEDAAAYGLCLKGLYLWNQRTEESLKSSLSYFQQAIEKDPRYALGWAGLADAYNMLGGYSVLPPGDVFPTSARGGHKGTRNRRYAGPEPRLAGTSEDRVRMGLVGRGTGI